MTSEPLSASYIELLGAIIRSGLKQEGPDYLLTDDGRYWCSVGDLDPVMVRRLAVSGKVLRIRHSAAEQGQKKAA